MNRLDIIKVLANKNNAKSYLEIGVDSGLVFDNISIPHKIGVDPDPLSKATLHCTSDEFFENNTDKFDIVFIDGLHYADQVEKDINNSLNSLNTNGIIICHDMLPNKEKIQRVPRQTIEWTGDCWKAWVKLRSQREDLSMFVVDTDYGCGIIKDGSQKTICINDIELTYDNFLIHRSEWMNIISVEQFIDDRY